MQGTGRLTSPSCMAHILAKAATQGWQGKLLRLQGMRTSLRQRDAICRPLHAQRVQVPSASDLNSSSDSFPVTSRPVRSSSETL